MITVLSNEFNSSVEFITKSLQDRLLTPAVIVANNQTLASQLQSAVKTSKVVILCGGHQLKNLVASTFNLSMAYDKFAEKNVEKLCLLTKQPMPPQYLLDGLCTLPETFVHYTCNFCNQSACFGEINKTGIFVVPANVDEVKFVLDTYLTPYLNNFTTQNTILNYKIFGLQKKDVLKQLDEISNLKNVTCMCKTTHLDTKLTVAFERGVSKTLISSVKNQIVTKFGNYLYSDSDQTLQQVVVGLLKHVKKRVAVAESLTGGLVSSKLVEVPGVSSVLYEGLVTYSIASKCNRLGISPHVVDSNGVVSGEVAKNMASGLLGKNVDFSIATTGFAGPESDGTLPVGLCYVAIGTPRGINVYKNVFAGDREQIRQQASNSALYFLWKALTTK